MMPGLDMRVKDWKIQMTPLLRSALTVGLKACAPLTGPLRKDSKLPPANTGKRLSEIGILCDCRTHDLMIY